MTTMELKMEATSSAAARTIVSRLLSIAKLTITMLVAALLLGLLFTGCNPSHANPEAVVSVSFAPEVPQPIRRSRPAVIRVLLNSTVHDIGLAKGVLYHAWTFNDHVPGPFIRARVGDTLEVQVTNEDPTDMQHNVDFHAVTGPGGGGAVTLVNRGQLKVARFKVLYPGLFVYHCGAPEVMDHIANGMYGLILVEPEDGLPPVDHEFYVMRGEFYTTEPPDPVTHLVQYLQANGLKEDPQYVVFNGSTMSLVGETPLRANTEEKVRIFFGNAGPNQTAAFHVIGQVFDKVYREGDLVSAPERDVQTTAVPPGGAAVVEFTPKVRGTYTLVDHAVFRLAKGAIGLLQVDGPSEPDVYSGDENPTSEEQH